MSDQRPIFGQRFVNQMASEDNPQRVGAFVREVGIPRGRINSGLWWELTDKRGSFWQSNPAHLAAVPSVGLRDRLACELANLEHERSSRLCETDEFYDDADRVLSVLHEAGTQDEGQEIKGKRSDLAALLGGAEVLLGSRAQVAGGALAVANGLVRPEARHDIVDRPSMVAAQPEAGTQDGGLVHSLAVALMTATTEAQEGIKPSDEALQHRDALVQRARAAGEGQRQHREMFDTFAPTEPTIDDLQRTPAEAGTQEDEADADVMAQISTMIPVREVVSEWRAWSPQSASRTKYRDRADAEADAQELLRNEYRDVVVQRRRIGPWLPVTPAPAVSGSPDTKEDA